MDITPKLRAALQLAATAPGHTMTRCCKGFRPAGQYGHPPVVTRRTANALVAGMLADYNDRTLPSAFTLTPKGLSQAAACA